LCEKSGNRERIRHDERYAGRVKGGYLVFLLLGLGMRVGWFQQEGERGKKGVWLMERQRECV